MPFRDLREALGALEEKGLIKHVRREVDKDWELSAVCRWIYMGQSEENRYAVMFDKVKGYSMPVVAGVLGGSYKTYAACLGIDPFMPKIRVMQAIRRKWTKALDNPIAPVMVKTGPCKDNIFRGSDINIHILPAPIWNPEKDGGLGYITSPYHITRDPDSGVRNVGTYRDMIRKEPNEMGISTAPGTHLTDLMLKNDRSGKITEIATVIGADPTIGMTSVTPISANQSELDVSGALNGMPVELVKCETVDLEVPATAEIVIEGRIRPEKDRPFEIEGPFGEYTGYQGGSRLRPVYEITCISYRNNPIYQAFISQMPPSESSKIRCISTESLLLRQLEAIGVTGVVDLSVPDTGNGNMAIVSIRKTDPSLPARVSNVIFSVLQPRFGKFVIVVDDDIDVYDLDNVVWAVTYRTSMSHSRRRAIHFVEGLRGPVLDYSPAPSAEENLKAKRLGHTWVADGVLIDATRPYAPYPVVSLPPAKYLEKARDAWDNYGLPPLKRKDIPGCIALEEQYIKDGISTADFDQEIQAAGTPRQN